MSAFGRWIGRSLRGPQWHAWSVLGLALAATLLAWRMMQTSVEADARTQFDAEAARIAPLVGRRLHAYEQVLWGGVSVFNTWGDVTRDQWRSYVDGIRIEDSYPGIQGIGYAAVVPPDGIDEHVRQVRAEGFPDYDLHPRGDRSFYTAIVFLEPFDWRNQRAFGYDMMSEATRRAAMEQARDTGAAAVSGMVTLLQETDTDTQPGFLIYLPVYRGAAVPNDVDRRRDELRGFVYAPFRMGDLMTSALGTQLQDIRLRVYDGTESGAEALMFDSAPNGDGAPGEADPLFTGSVALELPGHGWLLRFTTLPNFEANVDSTKPMIVLASGTLVSVLLFAIVWTMGRSAAQARRQEADFRYLFEKNPSMLWVFDRDTLRFLAVNEAASSGYGYSQDEFAAMRLTDIMLPDELPRLAELTQPSTGTMNQTGEWRQRGKSGEEMLVAITSFPITFAGHDAMLVVARNRTARRRAERAQRTSEALRAAVLDSALDAVIVMDENGRILEFNGAAEQTFGHRRDQVIGRELADVIVPEEKRESHRAGLARFNATGQSLLLGRRIELSAIRADGSEFPVELAINAAHIEGRTVFTGYLRDVTLLRSAQAELQQAQKMEAIGRLTGGVAHDFNNLLTVVLGNAEILTLSERLNKSERETVEQIVEVAERAADLTRQLLAFARRQPLQPREIDVAQLAERMTGILARTLGEHIEIQINAAEQLWPALADPAQVQSALLNIAINARDAMPGGGKLTIETRNVALDEDYAAQNADVTPGPYVMLALTDTGAGMDAETLAHAFEPFFSTKEAGKGSGLGLSMIYGFARQSGGHVKLYSEVGQGTTVSLYLPAVVAGGAAAEEPRTASDPLPHGRESILVVEDDDLVREYVVTQLGALGYEIRAAANGPSGLEILKSTAEIDLLFTDVVMPGGMNGSELAQAARALRPDIRVLYTSGYADSALIHHGRLAAGVQLLHKPYRRQDLARKVRLALDAPPG